MNVKVFFLMIIFIPQFAYSQDITKDEATIRVHYFFSQTEKAGEKSFRRNTMTLDIGSQMSYYYDETYALRDSLFSHSFPPVDRIQSFNVIKNRNGILDNILGKKFELNHLDGTKEKIYKNRATGEITIIDRYGRNDYHCNDPLGTIDWKITSDTATVLNYNCQKAKLKFRGRDYEAWFAPEIPINDGPWKFMGLPGLILKVNDTQGLIAFECVGLQNLETPSPIEIPDRKYIKCSRKELEKLFRIGGASETSIINGGNVTVIGTELSSSFQFVELE